MLYSWKAAHCRDCRRTQKEQEREAPCALGGTSIWRCSCSRCAAVKRALNNAQQQHGCEQGKVVQRRCYTPSASYRYEVGGGRLVTVRDLVQHPADPYSMLVQTSVRTRDALVAQGRMELLPVKEVRLPARLAEDLRSEAGPTVGGKRKRGGGGGVQRPLGSGQGELIPVDDPRHAAALALLNLPAISEHFPEAGQDLQKVVLLSQGVMRLSMRLGHCMLAGREHSSNNTYFDVTPGLARQRCWKQDCRARAGFEIELDTPDELFG